MEKFKKIIIDELEENHPARKYGYKYNIQTITNASNEKNCYYCGVGRFCKSLQEIYKTEAKQ